MRKQHDDPVLHLYGSPIPVVEESKFLGILFDRKLSFIPHIKYLKAKCLKALNLLKVLSHTSWGADRTTLLKLYRSLVRSKLDYGCIIYGSARKSYLQMLDPIHNQGLRLALGAFRTSPVASLYVEADEPSLYSRREKLSLQYAIRLAANPSNPAHEVTFPPNYVNLYEQKPKAIKSFGIRISPLLESANIKPQNIEKHFTPNIPAWCMKPPEILFDLHSGKKSGSNPHILGDDFREIQSRYKNYQHLYGSPIPVVEESKFLGILFDRKLSFIPHIKYLKAKCLKALNLLKVLSHTSWGADRTTLLKLYRSLVRSKLDYGCIIYGSARKSYLQMLDPIHNQGLRLALGAFRTSPVASLYVEADEPSLYSRREKLSLQYAIRLAANPSNPAHEVTFPPNYVDLYDKKPKAIKSFGIRISPLLESANIKPQNIENILHQIFQLGA